MGRLVPWLSLSLSRLLCGRDMKTAHKAGSTCKIIGRSKEIGRPRASTPPSSPGWTQCGPVGASAAPRSSRWGFEADLTGQRTTKSFARALVVPPALLRPRQVDRSPQSSNSPGAETPPFSAERSAVLVWSPLALNVLAEYRELARHRHCVARTCTF
jgi:hypothetical protein